jgi:hypothetical protein
MAGKRTKMPEVPMVQIVKRGGEAADSEGRADGRGADKSREGKSAEDFTSVRRQRVRGGLLDGCWMAVARHRRLLQLILLFKVAYWLGMLLVVWLWPDMDEYAFYHAFQRWPREGGPIFASYFATWDTAHYLYLSEIGYSSGARACAFYPLWPLLVRWLSPLFGGSFLVTGLLLGNVCSLAAWVIFHRLIARRWGKSAADWALAFLVAFPGSLFFQFNYTESLFLLLLMVLWWGLESERVVWTWLAGFLLPLTRAVGVLTVLPMAWHLMFEQQETKGRKRENDKGDAAVTWRRLVGCIAARRLWLAAAPLVGWGFYLILMWSWTGNAFEGFSAQRYWGVNSVGNLWKVPKFVTGFFTATTWHEYTGSLLDRCSFVLLLYCLPAMWRLDKSWLVWTCVLGLVPAMSGTFVSFTRYMSCAFPVFVTLGVVLGKPEWRWSRYFLLAVFSALHVTLVWRFVNFRWAG